MECVYGRFTREYNFFDVKANVFPTPTVISIVGKRMIRNMSMETR